MVATNPRTSGPIAKPLAPAAIAIALPRGFTTSGVTTWALRLVNTLAAHGRPAALIAHPETSGHARLTLPIALLACAPDPVPTDAPAPRDAADGAA